MEIRDSSQLKAAYGILNDMQGMKALPGREEAVQKHIKQLKRDIRAFLRQQEAKAERRIIREYGINGYVELVKLPGTLHAVEEAAAYFEEKEAVGCPDFPGGCTGRPFTVWYRVLCRRGNMWVYHSVSCDV